MAIASGLAGQSPRVDTLAFVALLEWHFRQPIRPGDTLRVLSRVESVEPRSRGRRALVHWNRRLVNQRGETVQEGRIQTLVRGRPDPAVDADPPAES